MCASDIRAKARASLTGNYWPAVLAALIAGFFGALHAGSFGISFKGNTEAITAIFGTASPLVLILIAVVGMISGICGLAKFVLGGVIQLGYTGYLLKQYNKEICSVKDLFSQFDYFAQGFLQKFLRGLFIFLWSLLLIIPGIIKSYSYAMTPFIMADNPSMTAKEAITASRKLMDGHKGELFVLELSFFGWGLLAVLTLGIGYIFLNPYVNAARAVFYRNLVPQPVVVVDTETPAAEGDV